MVTIHSETREITRSGQFWAFAHFSRHIRRGARRFDSAGEIAGVDHVAFENPDGQKVLVIANSGAARGAHVKLAGDVAEIRLPEDSLSTLCWS
jgi:glucosylceramidase